MTQHDDPLIHGIRISRWDFYMAIFDNQHQPLRGIRVESDACGLVVTHAEYLPTDPFIGIHTSGPRAGARITMVDLGWSAETVRGTR